jgi:hypothetical protein
MRAAGFKDHPGRVIAATVALVLATMVGPCNSAAFVETEARLGLLFGLAIGLAATRGLRAARRGGSTR